MGYLQTRPTFSLAWFDLIKISFHPAGQVQKTFRSDSCDSCFPVKLHNCAGLHHHVYPPITAGTSTVSGGCYHPCRLGAQDCAWCVSNQDHWLGPSRLDLWGPMVGSNASVLVLLLRVFQDLSLVQYKVLWRPFDTRCSWISIDHRHQRNVHNDPREWRHCI